MNTRKLLSKWSLGILLFCSALLSNANNLQINGTSVSGTNIFMDGDEIFFNMVILRLMGEKKNGWAKIFCCCG